MPSGYSYKIVPTANPLKGDQLYAGRTVCYNNVTTNPNNVGILEESKLVPGAKGVWTAVINGVREYFNVAGAKIENNVVSTTPILYGVLNDGDIDPTLSNASTRTSTVPGQSNTVSISYMLPKDYFAAEALNALIISQSSPLSMDDGTIALIAAKAYKIAAAMAKEAYGSRENDPDSSQTGSYVDVNPIMLQTNTERILYNINESIKAGTDSNVNTGIKINNIDKVKFDGTPTVNVGNMPNVGISGTVDVEVVNTTSSPVNTKEVTP